MYKQIVIITNKQDVLQFFKKKIQPLHPFGGHFHRDAKLTIVAKLNKQIAQRLPATLPRRLFYV